MDDLARLLDVDADLVRQWESGRKPIPHLEARRVEWFCEQAQREAALVDSKLPECLVVADLESRLSEEEGLGEEGLARVEEIAKHVETCPTCQARERYIAELFPPLKPYPLGGVLDRLYRVVEIFHRIRNRQVARLVPKMIWTVLGWTLVGGALVLCLILLRILFALPAILAGNLDRLAALAGELPGVLAFGVAAGAAAGFAFAITRPILRRLGAVGDYATGILCAFGYMSVLLFLAPSFGFDDLQGESASLDWLIVVFLSVLFGTAGAYAWRSEGSARKSETRRIPRWRLVLGSSVATLLLIGASKYLEDEAGTTRSTRPSLQELQAAVRENPDDPNASLQLAWALIDAGQLEEALPRAREAVRLNPEEPYAHNSLGWLLNQYEDFEDAVPVLQTAIRLDPDHEYAHHNLGWALLNLQRFDEADAAYREALRITPANAGARLEYGRLLAWTGRVEDGEREIRRAVRLDPKNAYFHHVLGTLLKGRGRIDEALEEFRAAARLEPDSPTPWLDIGVIEHLRGRHADALEAFGEAERRDPDYFRAQTLERLMMEASREGRIYEP